MLEKEDEKIKGEYESCVPHGRRRKFECTSIFQGEYILREGGGRIFAVILAVEALLG